MSKRPFLFVVSNNLPLLLGKKCCFAWVCALLPIWSWVESLGKRAKMQAEFAIDTFVMALLFVFLFRGAKGGRGRHDPFLLA